MSLSRWQNWLIICGVWILVALFFISQSYIFYITRHLHFSWYESFCSEFIYCFCWIIGTYITLYLAQRFRIERTIYFKRLLLHLSISLSLAFTIHAIHSITWMSRWAAQGNLKPYPVLGFIFANFQQGVLIYWIILLTHHAFNYYHDYQQGQVRASQLEAQLSKAQLQALKMQLNPHFLFNTLNSISTLMLTNVDTAHKMLARLGDFLRMTLQSDNDIEVTLEQELDFLKCYLEIEHMRFRDRMTVQFEIEERALDIPVPNMILQPIVENSIRYAVAPNPNHGEIIVKASINNSHLKMQVIDNGPGINDEDISASRSKRGIGLINTQSRLQQLYLKNFIFRLSNLPQGGFGITIEIPINNEVLAGNILSVTDSEEVSSKEIKTNFILLRSRL